MDTRLLKKLEFLENNHRHKALFLLLFRNVEFITSEELAEKLDVTSRTIKSDIKYMKQQFDIQGLCIISQRSRGFMIKVDNHAIEKQIKEYFKLYQADHIDNDFDCNVQYIMRRLLTSSIPMKMEDLQEELYLNTSNYMQREIREVKRILGYYNMKLVTKKKEGFLIKGNEYNRYLCMLKMYRYFGNEIEPNFKSSAFAELFQPSFATKKEIKEVVCNTLANTRIVFSDIYLERFILYLILLSNVATVSEASVIHDTEFDYKVTDEYQFVVMLYQSLHHCFPTYHVTSVVVLEHLTYLAIMSTDLYRFRDCTYEKYGSLIILAEEIRTFIVQQFEGTFNVCISDDFVFLKDLFKVLIPICMKIKLNLSDDVDLGFYNHETMKVKPVMKEFVHSLALKLHEKYKYYLSFREEHLFLNVFYEFVNNIQLDHKKMKVMIIALDGRISTQQLKFCIRKYFSSYVERIETRVLYELDKLDTSIYDCFFCMDFGKNMYIPYTPIYYFEEGMSDSDYQKKLQEVFLSSYYYGLFLPPIWYRKISTYYKLEEYPIVPYLLPHHHYMEIKIENEKIVDVYICLESQKESFEIHYFDVNDFSINRTQCYLILNLNISYNKQKFKMLLNVINKIAEDSKSILNLCNQEEVSIEKIFRKHSA